MRWLVDQTCPQTQTEVEHLKQVSSKCNSVTTELFCVLCLYIYIDTISELNSEP
jgi:hypothetical protein